MKTLKEIILEDILGDNQKDWWLIESERIEEHKSYVRWVIRDAIDKLSFDGQYGRGKKPTNIREHIRYNVHKLERFFDQFLLPKKVSFEEKEDLNHFSNLL
ncbi:hypothetical protein HYX19_00220, partial [Candidatus Woesearchaeota archaeon]|nr:hypothetical protein [Candidatus Woesearchaeota archaeon]